MLAAVQVVVQTTQHPVHEVARPVAAPMGIRLEERRPLGQRASTFSRTTALSTWSSAHSRRRRNRGANVRASGAWYAFQTRSRRASKVPFRCLARSRIFRNACSKQRRIVTPSHSARQAAWVAGQPSVLTVSGRILRVQVMGLLPDHAVGFRQVVAVGREGQGHPQATRGTGRGRQLARIIRTHSSNWPHRLMEAAEADASWSAQSNAYPRCDLLLFRPLQELLTESGITRKEARPGACSRPGNDPGAASSLRAARSRGERG